MKTFVTALLLAALAAVAGTGSAVAESTDSAETAAPLQITVYKTPSCGCCQSWVDYLGDRGFAVTAHNLPSLDAVKRKLGVDPGLASCHTAVVDGYVVEGHVPADDIRRLLSERPPVIGLTAPGMPRLSPGMMSEQPQDYDVLSFDRDGKVEVFSRY